MHGFFGKKVINFVISFLALFVKLFDLVSWCGQQTFVAGINNLRFYRDDGFHALVDCLDAFPIPRVTSPSLLVSITSSLRNNEIVPGLGSSRQGC